MSEKRDRVTNLDVVEAEVVVEPFHGHRFAVFWRIEIKLGPPEDRNKLGAFGVEEGSQGGRSGLGRASFRTEETSQPVFAIIIKSLAHRCEGN